jgi:hypothetical protein
MGTLRGSGLFVLLPAGNAPQQVGHLTKVRVGTYRLPLRLDQWELVLTDEDLEEWLAAG